MATIVELVNRYKQGELAFDAMLAEVPSLKWGQRHDEADGEVWWDGENTVSDVDIMWYENTITDSEREAILALVS